MVCSLKGIADAKRIGAGIAAKAPTKIAFSTGSSYAFTRRLPRQRRCAMRDQADMTGSKFQTSCQRRPDRKTAKPGPIQLMEFQIEFEIARLCATDIGRVMRTQCLPSFSRWSKLPPTGLGVAR
jgi:hypothetical protein